MIKRIKIFLIIVIGFLFLLSVNTKIANSPIGTFWEEHACSFLKKGVTLAAVIGLISTVNKIIVWWAKRWSHRIWCITVSTANAGVKDNIKHYLQSYQTDKDDEHINEDLLGILNYIIFANLLERFTIAEDLLSMLKDKFLQGKYQDEISYFFMGSRTNSSVLTFFNLEPDFKNECEQYSYDVSKRYTYNNLDAAGNEINIRSLGIMANELLHMGLYDMSSNIEDDIEYFRKLFAGVDKKLSDDCFASDSKEVFLFLQVLPCIQQKFKNRGIRDKIILKKISNIQRSQLAKKALRCANKTLRKSEGFSIGEYARSMGLISAYPKDFNLYQRLRLCYSVERRRAYYENMYHEQYKNTIALLLSAVPLKEGDEPSSEVIDMLFDIMNGVGSIC